MEKIFICNQVKSEILNICGVLTTKPYNLQGRTPLFSLGYAHDELYCRILEDKLQAIASQYQTGRQISFGSVSKNFTVNECIRLVLA